MKNLNFKSVILTITMLLTMGVSSAWGWNFSGDNFIYFHNKGSWADSGKMLFIGKSDWTTVYTMSAVTGRSDLWVVKITNAGWSDATYMAVAGGSSVWGEGGWGPSNRTNATHYTNTYTSGVDASNNQRYILIPSGTANNSSLSLTYLGTNDPNYTITVKAKVSTNGGSTYSEATSPGTLTASSKKFTAYNSCNSSTSLSSGKITCGYLASTTLTAPSTDPTGYTFIGWYNSSGTRQTTEKSLNITPTEDATYYAYYKANQYSGTINANGGAADKSYTATYGVGTLTIATAPSRTGYNLTGYYKEAGCSNLIANTSKVLQTSTTYTTSGKWTYTSAPTLYAGWTAKTYTLTLNGNGGSGHTASVTATYNSSTLASITNPTRTGYTFNGWHKDSGTGTLIINTSGVLQASTSYTGAGGIWTNDGAVDLYAGWDAKTTTVTYSQSGTGYGSGGPSTTKIAYYGSDMPSISGSVPTAANGYAFMGYYDAANGAGTQYNTSSGASARTWNKTASSATLYAYFKVAQVTANTCNSSGEAKISFAEGTDYVYAYPTTDPTPTGTTSVSWELRYDDYPYALVSGHDAIDATIAGKTGAKKFTASDLAIGNYKIIAILKNSSGVELTRDTAIVRISSDHTMNIEYICDGEVISTSSATVPALGEIELTAPTHSTDVTSPFFGYSFHHWVLPSGTTCISGPTGNEETKGSLSITISSSYEGKIRVYYTRRGLIFFKKPGDWTGSNVYYYNIGSASKWKDSGAGDWGLCTKDISYGGQAMTRIGTSDIYYYDFENTATTADDPGRYIAFADALQNGKDPMDGGCKVSWPIDYTEGYNAGTPLFVCANYKYHTWKANYYNGGYWTKYHRDWTEDKYTGYTLKIFTTTGGGRTLLKSIPFTSSSEDMSYTATVELEKRASAYGFKIVRDDNIWFKNDADGTMDYGHHTDWPFIYDGSDGNACGLTTYETGDVTFTLSYKNETHDLRVSVEYPIKTGDYRLKYKDNIQTKWIKSKTISKRNSDNDTVSFFIRKDQSPQLYVETATVNGTTGVVTWAVSGGNRLSSIPAVVSSKTDYGVFNVNLSLNGSGALSIDNYKEYTGDYYIRTDICPNKWDSYKTISHLMTYTEYSENRSTNEFGPLYSHYFCAWCIRGTNVKFCIANDYSPNISDTLIRDDAYRTWAQNMDEYGTLYSDGSGDPTTDKYSANIRFMWNRFTNEIRRAYVASATTAARQFLVLKGCGPMKDADGNDFDGEGETTNRAIFHDDQDFIYERIITIQPTTRAKVYACYAANPADVPNAQYFRGAYDSGNCGSTTNSIQIIGGTGSTFYKVRVIYDFKTNRLICAWMPNGVDVGQLEVDADVMVIRDHQEGADAITFTSSPKGELSKVKYVYGVMRFNRWTLNNRARGKGGADDQSVDHCNTQAKIDEYHPVLDETVQKSIYERALYFISFPFDVKLNEVFGFGPNTYGIKWVISEYNGKRRAQQGYFEDNCFNEDCTNWDYIWDPKDKILKANEGYLLSLEVDSMLYDNTNFWPNNISQKELFFPSAEPMKNITTTTVTLDALGPDYLCTKNYNFDGTHPRQDRRVYDSYWRCIGTPSYAPYGVALHKDDGSGDVIVWQTDYSYKNDSKDFPFIYAWNVTDNSLSVQSTSTFNFKPLHAYLAQNGNAIYWNPVSATQPASIVRRQRRAVDEDGDYYWRVILSRGGKEDDQTYVRMSELEQVTDTFDFGQDLSKEFNYGHSDIYTYIGQTRAAANSMQVNTETTTIIPLGLNIWAAGYHTISMPDGGDGVGIELVDLYTGERTNLSAGLCYSFLAEKGIIDDRFQLEISPIKGAHTGIEEITTNSSVSDRARKVMIDGNLYIVRDGQLYDARGARVR